MTTNREENERRERVKQWLLSQEVVNRRDDLTVRSADGRNCLMRILTHFGFGEMR